MNMRVYTNEMFYRAGKKATKIMFITDDFSFGVYLNNDTRKIECQKYLGAFNFNNINSGKIALVGLKSVVENWEKFSKVEKQYLYESSKRLTACYYKHVIFYAGFTLNEKNFILSCVKEYEKLIKELYYNCLLSYDRNHDDWYIYNENINQEKVNEVPVPESKPSNIRKSIMMFKMQDASNFQNLFNGNFYSIIEEKDNYIIIKDENGDNVTIRKNRGIKVNVYTEPETVTGE